MSEGEVLFIEKYRARVSKLSPDLRECAQSADAAREQRVRFGLLGEGAVHERRERHAGAKGRAQIDFMVAEQAGAQSSVRRQAHAVTASAVRVRHRRDHADGPSAAGKTMIHGRAIAAGGAR